MKISMLRDERGLTLIEILVAFLILSMALVTMMDGFALGGRINADTYRYNAAMTLAQSKIEEIKNNPYNTVVNVASSDFSKESHYSRFTGFLYTVTVENSGIINKTVTVTVFYSDEGLPRQLAITTEITKR